MIRSFLSRSVGSAGAWLVAAFALAAYFLKLALSWVVYGTNDVTYWMYFSQVIEKFGTFKVYSLIWFYNHPPLVSWILKIVRAAAIHTGLSFPFLFRLMPITADLASIFLIWRLLSALDVRRRVLICILCSLNPVNFLISGFHGNTDPVFVFLILATVYLLQEKRYVAAGLCAGVSVCIKIVPVLLLPAVFFYLGRKKDRLAFFWPALAVPVCVFLPYLAGDFGAVARNIFSYGGLRGIWGLPQLLREVIGRDFFPGAVRAAAQALFDFYNRFGVAFFLLFVIALSRRFILVQKKSLPEGCFLVFALFLSMSPGFGVQYLSWLSYFALMAMPAWGAAYAFLGGFFLFRVYAYWGGLQPPYYANSDLVGPWVGFEKGLGFALWFLVVLMLARFLLKTRSSACP